MLRKLPGIDIPIATEANILHAAAYLEFKHHVERLVRDRHDTAAYTCWMHAVQVGHSPFVLPTTTEIAVLPPLPKMPCCKPECPRCAAHSGGRGWAFGTPVVSSSLPMWRRMKPGSTTTTTMSAWTSFFCRRAVPRSQPKSLCHRICMPCSSGAQRVTLVHWGVASSLQLGGTGPSASLTWALFRRSWIPGCFLGPPNPTLGESGDRREQSSPRSVRVAGSPRRRPHGVGISLHWLRRPHMETVLGMLRGALCRVLRMEAQLYPLWGETEDAHPKLTTFQPRCLTPRSIFLLSEP